MFCRGTLILREGTNVSDYLRASEAAALLRVQTSTIRRYRLDGKITGYLTPGGQHLYKREELIQFLETTGKTPNQTSEASLGKLAFYVRSSDGDKTKIQNQITQLTALYGEPDIIYQDKASGLNENRRGLQRLMRDARNGLIREIHYTQKDRLTRFGYTYLEAYFTDKGIKMGPAFEQTDKTLQDELMQDFMNLIASFSGKFYRLRGYQQKRRLLQDAEQELDRREKATK